MPKYSKSREYLDRLQVRYGMLICNFYVWETLRELKAPNHIGQDNAKENADVMNAYIYFFSTAEDSLRVNFLLELCKLFDNHDDSLNIEKYVDYAEQNIKTIKVKSRIKHFKSELKKNADLIVKLKNFRDQSLCHDDRKKKSIVNITVEEATNLFTLVCEILDFFNLELNNMNTVYDYFKKDCKLETKAVIENLKKFKEYRLAALEQEHQNLKAKMEN